METVSVHLLLSGNLVYLLFIWWRICLQCRIPWFNSWVRKIPWKRDRLLVPMFLGFPGGSHGKESIFDSGDLGSIPRLRRSPPIPVLGPGEFHVQRSLAGCTVHGIPKSWTRLSNFHFHYYLSLEQSSVRVCTKRVWHRNTPWCGLGMGNSVTHSKDFWGIPDRLTSCPYRGRWTVFPAC